MDKKTVQVVVHPNPLRQDNVDTYVYTIVQSADDYYLEQLPVHWLSATECEICSIPLYAYNIALGDVVSIERVGDLPLVSGIKQASGRKVFRVWFGNLDSSVRDKIYAALKEIGCQMEWGNHSLLGVDASSEAIAIQARYFLTQFEEQVGGELFEDGNALPLLTIADCPDWLWLPNYIYAHPDAVWKEYVDAFIWLWLPYYDDANLYDYEQLPVRRIDANLFKVCCIPFQVPSIALGDIVFAVESGVQTVERSGNRTIRVWTEDEVSDDMLTVLYKLSEDKCELEWITDKALVLSVPPTDNLENIARLLNGVGWTGVETP